MPTMKTIAAEAGVSVMTVSLALRNHPRISEATRQRVQEVATRLGYRSNPMVASLMTHIRSSRPIAYQANLGFLADNLQAVMSHRLFQAAYEGIIKRAEELGFLVDVFSLDEHGPRRGRLEKVLESRNIQGIILAPLRKAGTLEGFDCSQWSTAALGNSVLSPRFHRVTHHQFHGMQLIIDNLTRLGYRRIGLAIEESVDNKVDRNWSSCLAGHHLRIPPKQRVPVLLAELTSPSLSRWLEKYRPDVVVGHDGLHVHLKRLGLRVPRDISFACLSVPSHPPSAFSGLNQNWRMVGAAAVDSVVAQIYRNERGVPESPKTIMLEGFWEPGTTAPGA
jgi:DNA-binding LacI/PurR family transcriptional regulator